MLTGQAEPGPTYILYAAGIIPLMHHPQWPSIPDPRTHPVLVIAAISVRYYLLPLFT